MDEHFDPISEGDGAKRFEDVCSENPECLRTRVDQVLEQWHEGQMGGVPPRIPPGVLRPWCGSKRLREFAVEISLTETDLGFLRELRIAW